MPSSNGPTTSPSQPGRRGPERHTARCGRPGGCRHRGAGCPHERALDRLNRLGPPWDEIALTQLLGALAGISAFPMPPAFRSPRPTTAGRRRGFSSNWSPAFGQAYELLGLHRFKLVVGTLQTDPMPFVWDIDTLYGADEPDPSPAARCCWRRNISPGRFSGARPDRLQRRPVLCGPQLRPFGGGDPRAASLRLRAFRHAGGGALRGEPAQQSPLGARARLPEARHARQDLVRDRHHPQSCPNTRSRSI